MVEVATLLPMGTPVQVYFTVPGSQVLITARGEVKNHYFLNFADGQGVKRSITGMGLRLDSYATEADLASGMGLLRLQTILH